MTTWEDSIACPICGSNQMVFASGPRQSSILIIGDEPGDEEIKSGKPYTGRTGTILRTELGRQGVDLNRIRITNVWQHPKTDNEQCFERGFAQAIEEAKNRKLILLIGSGTVKKFCGHGVEDYNGLLVTSKYLSAPYIMASVQPAVVWNESGTLGEVRFVMTNFCDLIHKEGIL